MGSALNRTGPVEQVASRKPGGEILRDRRFDTVSVQFQPGITYHRDGVATVATADEQGMQGAFAVMTCSKGVELKACLLGPGSPLSSQAKQLVLGPLLSQAQQQAWKSVFEPSEAAILEVHHRADSAEQITEP